MGAQAAPAYHGKVRSQHDDERAGERYCYAGTMVNMRRHTVPGRVRRRGATPSEVVAFGVAVLGLSVLTSPASRLAPQNAEVRECWAVQRTIDAALDAFESDSGPAGTDLVALLPRMVRGGYLSIMPEDPGASQAASHRHYGRRARGAVYCWLHGSPWPDGRPPPRLPLVPVFAVFPPPVTPPAPVHAQAPPVAKPMPPHKMRRDRVAEKKPPRRVSARRRRTSLPD
jgi:hypothetical protein